MWLTLLEVAQYLRVSKETIYKMVQQGQLPGTKIGNQWRFNRYVVDDYLKAHSNINSQHDSNQPADDSDEKEFANG